MNKQIYRPRELTAQSSIQIRSMGFDNLEGAYSRQGKNWNKYQVCRHDSFVLVAAEAYSDTQHIGFTRLEDYIKVNFWLSGRHTTVLDGFGQYDHDRPEGFLTSGPWDMVKVDVRNADTQSEIVALCILREFFPFHLGVSPEALPEPLRSMVIPDEKPFAFHRFSLTPGLLGATRAVLAAPFAVRRDPVYVQAKAIELMCLLINQLSETDRSVEFPELRNSRQDRLLREAREVLARRCAEGITLTQLSREVGLNRMALSSGFRRLFGMSVHDCLQKDRMQRAYDLLQRGDSAISHVAETVGFTHYCNFSTAFRQHFGCTPRDVRRSVALKNHRSRQ
jgi:AraC-like DNA-binding protein